MRHPSATRIGRAVLGGAIALASATWVGVAPVQADEVQADETGPQRSLHLVTLTGPGTAAAGPGVGNREERSALLERQTDVLDDLVAADPVYRWTTALNGFAVELTEAEVVALTADHRVAVVEPNSVLDLAAGPQPGSLAAAPVVPRTHGGAGVTIGFVDSGIAPESAVFAAVPGLGRAPEFSGTCQPGEGWSADTCNNKLVGARWFVAGFGPDRVKSTESLSAQDVLGHGTHAASVAAGNAGVSVRVDKRDAGRFGGVAPQARVAAYKACWAAPDPQDDGCASADVVTAIDRAVGDKVDVLNLSLANGSGIDTVQRALLGAAEADVVVVGAAGNTRRDAPSYAGHSTPWVLTVGAAQGRTASGRVQLGNGRSLVGGGRPRAVTTARVVSAGQAAAPGVRRRDARQCRAGTLDPRLVAGRIVVCERGGVARIDKSRSVAQADGVGMVMVNVRRGGVSADLHSVPTVHLDLRSARELRRWMRAHPRGRLSLSRDRDTRPTMRAAGWSAPGDPRGAVVKPDLVAAGDGALGAAPESTGSGWAVSSGTSTAAARTSGVVALLRSRHDWSADVVRSVVATTSRPLRGASVLAQGGGLLAGDVPSTHLALEVDPASLRRALEENEWQTVNAATVLLRGGRGTITRRVTNIGARAEYFSVRATGFRSHRVQISPLAVRLAPGESAAFRIQVTGPAGGRLDDGQLVWLGARGSTTRVPVALTR